MDGTGTGYRYGRKGSVMKVMYVGDPHIKPECLDEGQRLIHFIVDTIRDEKAQHLVFLGDLFHNHSIIHLSVLGFWKWAFNYIHTELPEVEVWALVGNHDMSGKIGDCDNALMLFDKEQVTIVDKPTSAPWGALLVPYVADAEIFVEVSNLNRGNNKLLVCHQTFLGSKYENGIFAKDGVDPNLLDFTEIISGHIHTPQKFGKVWYPGSPRWQTISDANVERAIWIVAENGKCAYSTDEVCKPIYSFVEREGDESFEIPSSNADVVVDVIGSEQWVRERAAALEGCGIKVRRFTVSSRNIVVKESDGLQSSFTKFVMQYKSKMGTSNTRIMEIAENRISWLKKTT